MPNYSDSEMLHDAAAEVASLTKEIASLRVENEQLREALEHMRWCRSCSEGAWSDCEGGRAAEAALAGSEKATEGGAT